MHYALGGSALVHAAAIGGAVLLLNWAPDAEDAAPLQTVSVEIVTLQSATTVVSTPIESDATETLIASGSVAATPVVPLPVEHVLEEQAVSAATTSPQPLEATDAVEPAAPLEAVETLPATETRLLAALDSNVIEAAPPPTLEPIEVTEYEPAPIPQTLTRKRPVEPTQPTREPPAKKKAAPPPQQAGNGGRADADTVAARSSGVNAGAGGAGGDAEVARYPSKVQGELRRALRYPARAGGASGEVHVSFVVGAAGQAGSIGIARSSGNTAIDQAGIDTVRRAAPFPPIPPSAGRSNWSFTVPLAFVR